MVRYSCKNKKKSLAFARLTKKQKEPCSSKTQKSKSNLHLIVPAS